MIDKLAKLPLAAQPGTDWRYGPSVDIQGYIVEKLSGQSLDVFLRTKIFEPLGMKDTGFWVDASKVGSRHEHVHLRSGQAPHQGDRVQDQTRSSKPAFLSGSGGLLSTTDDYFRFAQMMLNGGEANGKRFLKASTVELMRTNVLAEGVDGRYLRPQPARHRLRAGLRDRHGSCRGEHSGGPGLLLLGWRVRHLVLDRSDERCRRGGDDPERQRQLADRWLAAGATAVPKAGVSGVGGSQAMISRRKFLGTTAAAGVAGATVRSLSDIVVLAAQAPQGAPRAAGPAPDLVLVNGRIHTMDARNTIASTVTIRNGRFAAVGNAAPRGAASQVIDLRGRTVVPGLIDTHLHGLDTADRPGYHVLDVESATSIREVQDVLAAQRKTVPEGQWITAIGAAHPNLWAEHRFPTLKELDDAVPDRPVLLYQGFYGAAATNTPGKKFFDAADAAPPLAPGCTRACTSPRPAPSASPTGQLADRPRTRCTCCAGCRSSKTRSGTLSARWPIPRASA